MKSKIIFSHFSLFSLLILTMPNLCGDKNYYSVLATEGKEDCHTIQSSTRKKQHHAVLENSSSCIVEKTHPQNILCTSLDPSKKTLSLKIISDTELSNATSTITSELVERYIENSQYKKHIQTMYLLSQQLQLIQNTVEEKIQEPVSMDKNTIPLWEKLWKTAEQLKHIIDDIDKKAIDADDNPCLAHVFHELSAQKRFDKPPFLYSSAFFDKANANSEHNKITIGLSWIMSHHLSDKEVKALLAHEIEHLATAEPVLMHDYIKDYALPLTSFIIAGATLAKNFGLLEGNEDLLTPSYVLSLVSQYPNLTQRAREFDADTFASIIEPEGTLTLLLKVGLKDRYQAEGGESINVELLKTSDRLITLQYMEYLKTALALGRLFYIFATGDLDTYRGDALCWLMISHSLVSHFDHPSFYDRAQIAYKHLQKIAH